MATFCGTLDSPNLKIDAIFNVLQVPNKKKLINAVTYT